jgi:hypothetical protein
MRRSGTTILYDALLEDPGLACFYEPLREQKVSPGGGSGAREGDAFGATSAAREAFRREHYPDLRSEDFNWGGPRDPSLELETTLPPHCRDLLAHLLASAPEVAIKETRVHSKIPELASLAPEGVLVQVVRDPRAVAASIVLGRGRKRLERLGGVDGFFADRSDRKLWSSREISERLIERGVQPADPTNVERVLMVWAHTFERARADGLERFGERYVPIRNEDLRVDAAGAIAPLYEVMGRQMPDAVAAWAKRNVRAAEEPFAASDARWAQAFARTGIADAASAAGYEPPSDPAGTLAG